MPWQTAALQFPPSAEALSDGADAALSQGREAIATALAQLDAVDPQFTLNPAAPAAAGSAAAQQDLTALFTAALQLLVVHPYLQGIGTDRHLSAPNAQLALASKLQDHGSMGTLDAVCFLIAAPTLTSFAEKLTTFAEVFPLPELQLAQRRAQQLLRLEVEKTQLPGAPQPGLWRPRRLRQLHSVRRAQQLVAAELAAATSFELESTDPLTELRALADKKQRHLDTVRSQVDDFAAQLKGSLSCLFVSGSPAAIAHQLKNPGPYGHDQVLTAGVLITGAAGTLTALRELFGESGESGQPGASHATE